MVPSHVEGFKKIAEAVRQTSAIVEAGHIDLQSPIISQADADRLRVRFLRLFGELIHEFALLETSLNQAVEAAEAGA